MTIEELPKSTGELTREKMPLAPTIFPHSTLLTSLNQSQYHAGLRFTKDTMIMMLPKNPSIEDDKGVESLSC